jgi:hypothetical protein
MSNYTQTTFFAPKDSLLSGDPNKKIKGAQIDPEFAAIAVAIASKLDTTTASANPSAQVGLTAVNGSSASYMRADAAPALNVGISPTWTGAHTFSPSAGAIKINTLAGQVGLQINMGSSADVGLRIVDPGINGVEARLNTTNTLVRLQATSPGILVFSSGGSDVGQFTSTTNFQVLDDSSNYQTVGWRDAPQRAITVNGSLVLADRGKSVQANGGSVTTITIPANASVAFPIGTCILLVNNQNSNLTVAITTDSLYIAGTTTGGAGTSRTLANNGVAMLYKFSSTGWFISGSGVS